MIDGSGFSKSLTTKLERGLNRGSVQSLDTTISVKVDDSGRLFFDAKSNKTPLGRGELRYDATEVDPQPQW